MIRSFTRIAVAAFAMFCAVQVQATVIYVNVNATGSNNGTSWANAFTSLQSGIGATFPGDTIWVAQGVYKPTTTTTRTISFVLPDAVKIFGGFNGTETSVTQQNVTGNLTTLSGDIGVTGNATDNSFHVLTAANISSASLLDGFRVVSGSTTGMITGNDEGAGMTASNAGIVVRNCTFMSNTAKTGAALSLGVGNTIYFINCTIMYNVATGVGVAYGGAIRIAGGTANFSGCRIMSNSGYGGGGFHFDGGLIKIDRCDISGNTATTTGGAIYGYQDDFTLTLTNSLIVGNNSTGGASAIYCVSSPLRLHRMLNCTVADNAASPSSTSCSIFNSTSQIDNTVFAGNSESSALGGNGLVTNNLLIQGTNLTNPMFIAPGTSSLAPFMSTGYNYHAAAFSPLTDYGSATYLIPIYNTDLDNNPRNQGLAPDAGCYENSACTFNLDITSIDSSAICPGTSTTLSANAGTTFLWSDNSTGSSITVNTAGTYTLMADSAGCLGSASYQVSLLPAAVNISGASGLCPNTSTTLNATGPNISTYMWNTGGTADSLLVTTAGTYSVFVTTTEGCTATATYTVTALPGPNPVISFNTPVLSTGTFTSYQWLLNGVPVNGATNAQYTATQDGNYAVVVTNSSGCSDTSAVYTIVALGLGEINSTGFSVYPNPGDGNFSVRITSDLPELLLTVCDMQGRIIFREAEQNVRTGTVTTLSLSGLADGIYFLQLQNGNDTRVEKLVIRR